MLYTGDRVYIYIYIMIDRYQRYDKVETCSYEECNPLYILSWGTIGRVFSFLQFSATS